MPSLKQLTCSIELGSTHTKITEYGKDYGDGHVTSYIAVPSEAVNFSIHLTSHGYVAPGLAMFVYMDGQYQCNRNRRGLMLPGKGVKDEQFEVDLRVRQKESKQSDGSFLGRDWTFHGLNLVSADKVEETDDVFLDNLGTIEVIVLRCKDAPLPPPSVLVVRESSSRATSNSSPRPPTKPESKHSASKPEKKEPSKHSSRQKQKEPSAKEKAPSNKESSVGGMFGLFDGASDEPDGIPAKPYWNDWNKRPALSGPRLTRDLYIAPEEPLPLVPKHAARSKHVEHQVKTGKGAQYLHLCARPEYLDSMKQPYAVFIFKYRSKKFIERKFKVEIKEEGKNLKAKIADMSKDELAEELYRLRVSGNTFVIFASKHTKLTTKTKMADKEKSAKAISAARAPTHKTASAQLPTKDNAWEKSADKTPTKPKSKAKTATAPPPADWAAVPPANDWATVPAPAADWATVPEPVKASSKSASKLTYSPASKTPSQKTKDAPGAYPDADEPGKSVVGGAADSSHHTASEAANAARSASKKSSKKEPSVAAADAAWNTVADAAWNTGADAAWGAGNAAWGDGGGKAASKKKSFAAWGNLRVAFTIMTIIAATALAIIAYYWIKSYILQAIAFCFLLKAWIVAPFAWTKDVWLKMTEISFTFASMTWTEALWSGLKSLSWIFTPLVWLKNGLLKLMEMVSGRKFGKPRFVELEFWRMEWLQRPDWLVWPGWPGWNFHVPGVVKNGSAMLSDWVEFVWSIMRPDGVQALRAVDEVLEEI
ncbi:hypothetical protein E4T39_07328 [Aureobasidium subglaciale]|nr:hypothetical protein E4T39_07328 [Aureobasidium subglaciale]